MKFKITEKVHGYYFLRVTSFIIFMLISFTCLDIIFNQNYALLRSLILVALGFLFLHFEHDKRFAEWFIDWGMTEKTFVNKER